MNNINEIFKPLLRAIIGSRLTETIYEAKRLYECMPIDYQDEKDVIVWRREIDGKYIYDFRIEPKGKYKKEYQREDGLLGYDAICIEIINN